MGKKIVDKRFTFMESYLRSISMIRNEHLKLDFLLKVLNYGLYQIEPSFDDDFAKGHFEEIKSHIDLSNYQREKNRINGSKGGAPVGNSNAKKQPKTTETSKNNLIEINRKENNRIECKSNVIEENYKDFPAELIKPMKDYEEMRILKNDPLNEIGRKIILKNLKKISNGDIDYAIECLNQSTLRQWRDVYPLKKSNYSNADGKGISADEILNL